MSISSSARAASAATKRASSPSPAAASRGTRESSGRCLVLRAFFVRKEGSLRSKAEASTVPETCCSHRYACNY